MIVTESESSQGDTMLIWNEIVCVTVDSAAKLPVTVMVLSPTRFMSSEKTEIYRAA